MEVLMNSHYIICLVVVYMFLVGLGHHMLGASGSHVLRTSLSFPFSADDRCVFVLLYTFINKTKTLTGHLPGFISPLINYRHDISCSADIFSY